MSSSERVAAAARLRGLSIQIEEFPAGTKTAADAAAAVGCPLGAIVKSLVFVVDGEAVVGLVPGDLRLDAAKLAAAVGGREARRASLEEVREATGYAAGGTPPFGHARRLRVIADARLGCHSTLWAAGGTPATVFRIEFEDLLAASAAEEADITEA